MQLWNKPKILVFMSSWRRWRVTFTDKIFKPIYNKTMPTNHLVKNQRRWFRTWAMLSYLSYARQFTKCNAKNAFWTGIKASFTALVGISWEKQSTRGILRWQLDLSIPKCVVKKWRTHGTHHGKTEEQIKHNIDRNLRKRCIKWSFEGIHDRFQNDPTFRDSLLSTDRTEEVCIQMDKDAQKDFTYRMSQDESFRCQKGLVDLSQHIWTQWTDETPFRLQRRITNITSSSPWDWRRATRTDSFLAISEMASVVFFVQYISVAVERFVVELTKNH